MHTRVKLLSIFLVVLLLNISMALAQEETPPAGQGEQTATALIESDTSTPDPAEATEEAAADVTAEATAEPAVDGSAGDSGDTSSEAFVGLPLGVLLFGAVAVLMIGTIVLVRENPRPLDDEE